MSDIANSESTAPRANATIDPEAIVIAIPRRGSMAVSGGVRTLAGDRITETDLEETEPVLAD